MTTVTPTPHSIVKIDPTTPWREAAGAELTDDQRKQMEDAEQRYREVGVLEAAQRDLLRFAIDFVNGNRIDADHAHIEPPVGAATDSAGWERDLGGDTISYSRSLTWQVFDTGVDSVGIDISGRQSTDGSFTRQIQLYADFDQLDAGDARRVAAALVEAADALDALRQAGR